MKKFLMTLQVACIHWVAVSQNVVQLEYFIDTDAGVGNNTIVNVTPANDDNFPFTVNLAGVAVGYHNLYIRVKDDNGKWGITARRNIQVIPSSAGNNIIAGEYFFDTDPGIAKATPFAISLQDIDINQNFTTVTASLSTGYHKFYTRTRDAEGNWSISVRRNIEVPEAGVNSIIAAEYFFDTDPGIGKGTAINVSPQGIDITQAFTATTLALSRGYHKLYVRTLDQPGRWSLTARRNVEVIATDAPLYLTGVEYFFGNDPGVGHATLINFETPLADGSFDFTIPASEIPNGADTLYLRVKDSTNMNWSLTAFKAKYFVVNSCPSSIWLGTISSDWNNPVNWSCNQVPDATTDVTIVSLTPFTCEVLAGNTGVCHKIMAVPGAQVKINTGATLTITGL